MTADSIKKSKSLSVFKDSAVCLVVLTAATLAGYAFKAKPFILPMRISLCCISSLYL